MKRVMSTTGSGPNMEPKLKQKGNMTRHHIETMFTMEGDDEDLKPKQEGNIEVMVKVEVANVDSMTDTSRAGRMETTSGRCAGPVFR